MPRPAIFLDRDDTINRNADLPDAAWGGGTPGDLLDGAYAELLPGVSDALARLSEAGFAVVFVTNQGGVARGGGSITDIEAVNDALRRQLPLGEQDPAPTPFARTLIDAAYACPFHPAGTVARFADEHPWRKPAPGMFAAAAVELDLDLTRSWMVGDKQRDLDAAITAGVDADRCILVGRDAPAPGLSQAADMILGGAQQAGDTLEVRVISTASITLRAHTPGGSSGFDEQVRETVIASAHALAERIGVELVDVRFVDAGLRAHLGCSRIAAMGFAAELRRLTNAWHQRHRGTALWVDRAQ